MNHLNSNEDIQPRDIGLEFLSPNSEWKIFDENKETLSQQLLAAMQMQNIIVLAGCGTSLGTVGGPSMKTLWNCCMKEKNNYTSTATGVAQQLKYNISEEEQVNIEEFLSLCEAYLQINDDDQLVREFLTSCKQKIISACSYEKNTEAMEGHRTFVHRLSRRRVRDSRLKLFTTNYDTCFEEAASFHGIVVIDGFSFSFPRQYEPRFFDLDIVRRINSASPTDNYLEGVFQLYKLHGSVNWEKQTNGSIIEREATPDNACMIFPAKGKYQQSYIQPHLELMARYLASLRDPNSCLIITGFGFNDDHLAAPIISAIQTNPHLKVIIADYNAKNNVMGENENASQHWEKLKALHNQGEDILFINSTFQEFAKIIPDLRSLSPAEKMVNAIQSISGVQ